MKSGDGSASCAKCQRSWLAAAFVVQLCDMRGWIQVWLYVAQSEGVATNAAVQLPCAVGVSMPLCRGYCGASGQLQRRVCLARGPASWPNICAR